MSSQNFSGAGVITGSITRAPSGGTPSAFVKPNSKIIIELLDVSLQDAPSKTIATKTISSGPYGRRPPIKFVLYYRREDINPRASYSISVRIEGPGNNGKVVLQWISKSSNPVLTQGHGSTRINIQVSEV